MTKLILSAMFSENNFSCSGTVLFLFMAQAWRQKLVVRAQGGSGMGINNVKDVHHSAGVRG